MTKELTFSSNIGQHDLDTKSKQIQQWIEKKYRVQITVKKAKNAEEPEKMVSESKHESLSFSDREIQLRNLENGRRREARAILSGRDQFSGVFRMQA